MLWVYAPMLSPRLDPPVALDSCCLLDPSSCLCCTAVGRMHMALRRVTRYARSHAVSRHVFPVMTVVMVAGPCSCSAWVGIGIWETCQAGIACIYYMP